MLSERLRLTNVFSETLLRPCHPIAGGLVEYPRSATQDNLAISTLTSFHRLHSLWPLHRCAPNIRYLQTCLDPNGTTFSQNSYTTHSCSLTDSLKLVKVGTLSIRESSRGIGE